MMALSTSASSGLTTRSRSASVLDGAICSSGTSSPVPGSRYWTRLWWLSSSSSSTRMPVARSTSTAAQAQNAWSSSPVRSRRFPLAGSPAQTLTARGPGGGADQGLPGGGEGLAPGLAARAACSSACGVGVLLGDGSGPGRAGRGAARGSGRPSGTCGAAGPCAWMVSAAADRAGDRPLCPPGRVIDGPLGQVEVEGPDRGQALAVADPLDA